MNSLAWSLIRTTERAALAAWPQTGCGDKNAIDDLALSLSDNLRNVARALGKPLSELRMVTLDKPRSQAAIQEAAGLGVKVFSLPDGDVAASVLTCQPDNVYDLMFTVGGAPEGVLSACAVRAMAGDMQAELIDYCQAKGECDEHRRIATDERAAARKWAWR